MNNEFCFVKNQNGGFNKVNFEEILFVKSLGNYLQFVTTNGSFVSLGALQSLEAILSDSGKFARAHKSYVVNLERIDQLSPDGLNIAGHAIPVGGKFLDHIKNEFILEHLLKI